MKSKGEGGDRRDHAEDFCSDSAAQLGAVDAFIGNQVNSYKFLRGEKNGRPPGRRCHTHCGSLLD